MNRFTKRLLALTGSALVGAFGAIALASPAQAHHPIVSGTAVCQANGQYKITWKVGNGNWGGGRYEKIKVLTPTVGTAADISGFGVNTIIAPDGQVTGVQMVPGNTDRVGLTVTSRWYLDAAATQYAGVEKSNPDAPTWATGLTGEDCEPEPVPTAKFTNNCDGTVNVHIINPTSNSINFTVKAGGGWTKTVAVTKEIDVVVPAENANAEIVVTAGQNEVAKGGPWARPASCPKPSPLGESTCDSFTIKLTNPQEGLATTATVTYGTQVVTKDIAAGKTETVSLSPSSETEATIKFAGWDDVYTVNYEKPANCGGLPQTGASTGTYIASGSGLAALGVLVFFLARRRQVRLRRIASM